MNEPTTTTPALPEPLPATVAPPAVIQEPVGPVVERGVYLPLTVEVSGDFPLDVLAVECSDVAFDDPDMAAVADMLDRATEHGLAVEVVQAFGNERAAGIDTQRAASAALYEWDI